MTCLAEAATDTVAQIVTRSIRKSDKVTLSKFEFDALTEVIDPALKASSELSMLRMEITRTRRVATPAWKACERVSRLLAKHGCKADERKVREWKFVPN